MVLFLFCKLNLCTNSEDPIYQQISEYFHNCTSAREKLQPKICFLTGAKLVTPPAVQDICPILSAHHTDSSPLKNQTSKNKKKLNKTASLATTKLPNKSQSVLKAKNNLWRVWGSQTARSEMCSSVCLTFDKEILKICS